MTAAAGAHPVQIPPPAAKSVDLDKNWTVCDNGASSPFRGHCYTELDNFGEGDRELMSTSTDGGLTWSVPIQTAGHDKGLGGQPVVQPDGTVIVPFESLNGKIAAFASTDGGASWTKGVKVAGSASTASPATCGPARCPSAEIAGDGTVYVAWEDCRFRRAVRVQRHRVLDVDRRRDLERRRRGSRSTRHQHGRPLHPRPGRRSRHRGRRRASRADLLLLSQTPPAAATCRLEVGYISSPDGGAHWGDATAARRADGAQPRSRRPRRDRWSATTSRRRSPAAAPSTVFAVGRQHPPSTTFRRSHVRADDPAGRRHARPGDARWPPPPGAGPVTGVGTGETHHALRDD